MATCQQELLDLCADQSRVRSLSGNVQEALSFQRDYRALRLMSALLTEDDEDDILFTEEEMRRALARGKTMASEDGGITYSVLRLLQMVPGNPLFKLYSLCYR